MKKIKVLTNEHEKQNSKNYCNLETNYRQYEQSTQNFKKPITELQIKNQLVCNFEVEVMALTKVMQSMMEAFWRIRRKLNFMD